MHMNRPLAERRETEHLGRLPLHCCAAGDAPLASISFLVETYPQALKATDAAERTPLHLACAGAAPEASIRALLDADLEPASMADMHGMLPLDCALEARPHDSKVLQLLAGVSPMGSERLLKFFMDKLQLDAPRVVLLAQQLAAQQQQQQQQQGGVRR